MNYNFTVNLIHQITGYKEENIEKYMKKCKNLKDISEYDIANIIINYYFPKNKLLKLLKEPVKKIIPFSGDSAGGIFIYKTTSNKKYAIKPEYNAFRHIQASKVAKILGVNVPEMIIIPKIMINHYDKIYDNIMQVLKFSEGYDELDYILMEYIPSKRLHETKIPEKYCDDVYKQAGKIMVFDIIINNIDRFGYINDKKCNHDVNKGNLIISKDYKLYAIDNEAHEGNQLVNHYKIFDELLSDQPYDEDMKFMLSCVLVSFGNADCTCRQKITDSAIETVEIFKKNYKKIKEVFPGVRALPKK